MFAEVPAAAVEGKDGMPGGTSGADMSALTLALIGVGGLLVILGVAFYFVLWILTRAVAYKDDEVEPEAEKDDL